MEKSNKELTFVQSGNYLKLNGIINEYTDFDALFDKMGDKIIMDLGGVEKVNSYGIRSWINAINRYRIQIEYIKVTSAIFEQFCLVDQLTGNNSYIFSFFLEYYCLVCNENYRLLVTTTDFMTYFRQKTYPAPPICNCGRIYEFDGDKELIEHYFSKLYNEPVFTVTGNNLANFLMPRKPFNSFISLFNNQTFKNSPYFSAEDISNGGLFVIAEIVPQAGEKVQIEFEIPEGGGKIKCESKVAWIREEQYTPKYLPKGFGLEFIDIPAQDKDKLQQYIDKFIKEFAG